MLTGGAIVPHAPLLLPRVSRRGAERTHAVRGAISDLQLASDGVVIVCSPHGRAASVYRSAHGDLTAFGVPHVRVDHTTDAGACEELARLWRKKVSADPLDHGAVVPLLLGLARDRSVACCSLPEGDVDGTFEEAEALARAIERLAQTRDVAVIASAHTSAGLNARAPVPETPVRWETERSVRVALENDLGALVRLAPDLARDGGSCSASTLWLVGRLFGDRPGKLLCAVEPFGVGYVVLQVS